jgi:hypothetical protein
MGKLTRKIQKALGFSKTIKVSQEDQDLLDTIREHVALDLEATSEQRELELDDLRFCDPDTQWDDEDRRAREEAGRPVLSEDHLGPFLNNVINEQRKNKPSVQVDPVGGGADVETAEVIQGVMRHDDSTSDADCARDTAFESMVRCGRGFYRICTDYVDEQSFDQEVKIRRIPNIHMVFTDPAAQEADYSDAKWGGFKAWMSQEDFKATWPDAELSKAGASTWASIGDEAEDWMNKDGGAIMVVEYYWKDVQPSKIYQLEDGSVVRTLPEGGKAKAERDSTTTTLRWVKCTAVEILERGEFPAPWVPIIPVLGKELIVNGKKTYSGLIRPGKGPQKRLNYLLTSQVERIAFHPIATWVGARGFMGQMKKVWSSAHKTQVAALEYEIVGDDGDKINAPRLITEEPAINAITGSLLGAQEGIKASLGMFDPSLGNREGSQSGLAIGRLQAQGETGNFHFQDNLSRSIRHEGRIRVHLMSKILDTDRVERIIGDDGARSMVRINAQITDPSEAPFGKKEAIGRMFDMTTGKYDVITNTGPSYQSKRQEDRAMLLGMLTGPMGQQIATAAPDLMASTLDSPIAKKLSERLKKLLPPQLQDEQTAPQIPPQVQHQMQQMEGIMQQMGQALQEAQKALETKQIEIQAALQKEQLDNEAMLQKTMIESETKKEIAALETQGRASIEAQKLELEQQKLALEAERLALEVKKQNLEELRLFVDSQKAPEAPEGVEPEEPEEPEEPKAQDPMHALMQGHSAALSAIAEALKRTSGRKRLVMDAMGSPIGIEPEEEGE